MPIDPVTSGVCPLCGGPAEDRLRVYSINETARICGLNRVTLYKLISQKKLSTIKIGPWRLVSTAAIDALLSGGAQFDKTDGGANERRDHR